MITIEPHYLPSLEYFIILSQADSVHFETQSPFKKQTFRNRCYILSSNKVMPLIVPVHFHQSTQLQDVTIDYQQSWVKDHWGAIYSSYGKSPFFEYFSEEFQAVLKSKPDFLVDLNHAMLSVCLKVLQWQIDTSHDLSITSSYDLRDLILPKKSFDTRDFYKPISYQQNFGKAFVPNLSILDLLFCQGPVSGHILRNSIKSPIEPFRS
ncbi:MAG: WbqC family protein [Cytophagales bacterium]|nr:WbqC family protein [Cytophagales bacterium]